MNLAFPKPSVDTNCPVSPTCCLVQIFSKQPDQSIPGTIRGCGNRHTHTHTTMHMHTIGTLFQCLCTHIESLILLCSWTLNCLTASAIYHWFICLTNERNKLGQRGSEWHKQYNNVLRPLFHKTSLSADSSWKGFFATKGPNQRCLWIFQGNSLMSLQMDE